jgi:hypothetical protein
MAWTKEQLRQKRRALGIPERDPFSAPRFIAMGEEPDREADADHVGRHRSLRARPDVGAAAGGDRQGSRGGQIQGPRTDCTRQGCRRASNGKGGPDARHDRGRPWDRCRVRVSHFSRGTSDRRDHEVGPDAGIRLRGSAAAVLPNGSRRRGRQSKLPQPEQHGQRPLQLAIQVHLISCRHLEIVRPIGNPKSLISDCVTML